MLLLRVYLCGWGEGGWNGVSREGEFGSWRKSVQFSVYYLYTTRALIIPHTHTHTNRFSLKFKSAVFVVERVVERAADANRMIILLIITTAK